MGGSGGTEDGGMEGGSGRVRLGRSQTEDNSQTKTCFTKLCQESIIFKVVMP